ncbi:MAG: zf-HC2 domain-containing protein [Thiobacillaceae bacterium]
MRLIINCKENSQLVTKSWDRRLSVKDHLALRIHLFVCENCRRFVRQMHLIREWLRHDDRSDGLSEQARTRIARNLPEQGKKPG